MLRLCLVGEVSLMVIMMSLRLKHMGCCIHCGHLVTSQPLLLFSLSPSPQIQAIGDGGQGWGNFILYVMVSDKIRNKLLGCCRRRHKPKGPLGEAGEGQEGEEGEAINYGINEKTTSLIHVHRDVETFEPTTM